MKKKLPLWTHFITGGVCLLLSALITLMLCNRYMYLATLEDYERQLAELSEELAPQGDATHFADLAEKFKTVYNEFVDAYPEALDFDALESALLKDFVKETGDRYARYYTAEEYAAMQSSSSNSGVGIGITVTKSSDGRAIVTYIEKDGPAEKAKLAVGDEITAVDGYQLGDDYNAALGRIKGDENTTVTLTVLRGAESHNIVITRAQVNYATVHEQLDGEIGFLRILSFGGDTAKELEEAIGRLTSAGAQYLVFDLRDTSGGGLTSLHKCLDLLLPDKTEKGEEQVAFSFKLSHDNMRKYVCSDEKQVDLPMAVLINESTTKYGEVFAGALRDLVGARIYGKTSHGNGTVQALITLKDGSRLIVTTSQCILPSGQTFNGTGITPDEEIDADGIILSLTPLDQDAVYLSAAAGFGK